MNGKLLLTEITMDHNLLGFIGQNFAYISNLLIKIEYRGNTVKVLEIRFFNSMYYICIKYLSGLKFVVSLFLAHSFTCVQTEPIMSRFHIENNFWSQNGKVSFNLAIKKAQISSNV